MAERNINRLLNNDAAPVSGVNSARVIQWYGGPLRATVAGVFDGATVELVVCVRLPDTGDRQDYANPAKFGDADWHTVATATEPGTIVLDNINPCALAARVKTVGTNTRLKLIVS